MELGYSSNLPTMHGSQSRQGLQLERAVGAQLDDVETDALSPKEFVLWRAIRAELNRNAEGTAFSRFDFSPLSLETGTLRVALEFVRRHPLKNESDIERYLYFLDGLTFWFSDLRTIIEENTRRGISLPPAVGLRFAETLDQMRRGALREYLALDRGRGAELSDERFAALSRDHDESIALRVLPVVDSLAAYLRASATAAPPSSGLWESPGGKEYYRFLLRANSGLEIDPQLAHGAGIAQLRRLDSLLAAVRRRNGWPVDPRVFHDSLRAEPRYNADLPTVARRLEALIRQAAETDSLFTRLGGPPATVRVANLSESMLYPDGAVLRQGLSDSTPEIVVTERWRSPSVQFELTSRTYRWGWPGRALAMSAVARNMTVGAFIELHPSAGYWAGWEEYAGALAGERGWYRDPLDAYAQLMHEAFSAALLVAETGFHYFGWSRSQTLAALRPYTLANGAELDTLLIERIAATPGRSGVHALAARELLALRTWMERELGAAFKLEAWHEEVLSLGPVNLPILAGHLEWWAWDRRRAATPRR
jgi:uncharacterized protein (DUF885 family)